MAKLHLCMGVVLSFVWCGAVNCLLEFAHLWQCFQTQEIAKRGWVFIHSELVLSADTYHRVVLVLVSKVLETD